MTDRFRVAVVGAGPSGSALAAMLALRGADVTLFDDGRRPELVVGESLVPAVVPILRRLGVEEATAGCSLAKPGVTFVWSETDRFGFTFARFAPDVFPYAYNVPRPQFDEVIAARAAAAGVTRVGARARLEAAGGGAGGAELALARETLDAAPSLGGRQPDLVVDATGRARLSARVLGIGADVGPRRDVAHFGHFEDFHWEEPPGQVLIRRRAGGGWSWCIPLQGRLSVGIVVGQEAAAALGRTPEERLARAIETDPWLGAIVKDGKRVTPVVTYTNYQLVSRRGVGPGWVAAGDAFGFVDPMLSPGVFLALHSAETIADALAPAVERRSERAPARIAALLGPYAIAHRAALAAWQELVGQFYDGRMMALMRAGQDWVATGKGLFKDALRRHIERHVALQASGMRTTSRYSRGLLRFLARHGLRGVRPEDMAIG